MISHAQARDAIECVFMETRDHIARMQSDHSDRGKSKFTTEEISKRRRKLLDLRQAAVIIRALAECPDAQAIVDRYIIEKGWNNDDDQGT